MRLLYLRQDKHQLHYHSSAAWGESVQYTKVCERQSGSLNIRPCWSSAKPQTQRMALWGTLGSAWARLWMYLRYLLYYERCWVVRVQKGSQGTSSSLAGAGARVARARFSKHTWRKARLRMLVVSGGPRNLQHAVYVGVEHWRHLHSWPCDRNRNEGNRSSSQQQCRTVRYGFVYVWCVHARSRSEGYQDCHHGVLLGDGRRSIETEGQLVRPAEHP